MKKLLLGIIIICLLSTLASAELIVSNFADDSISILSNDGDLNIIDVGDGPNKIKLYNNWAIVSNTKGSSISIVDLLKKELIAEIPVGKNPIGVEIAGAKLYVANSGSNTVSVVDLSSLELEKTIRVGEIPVDLVISNDRSSLYVSNLGSDTISVVDLSIGHAVQEIRDERLLNSPAKISLSPDNSRLYVIDTKNDNLVRVDLDSNVVREGPISLPDVNINNNLILGNMFGIISSNEEEEGEILIIDLENEEIINALSVDKNIYGVDFKEGSIYVTKGTNEIEILDIRNEVLDTKIVGNSPRSIIYYNESRMSDGGNIRRFIMWLIIVALVFILIMRARVKRKEYEEMDKITKPKKEIRKKESKKTIEKETKKEIRKAAPVVKKEGKKKESKKEEKSEEKVEEKKEEKTEMKKEAKKAPSKKAAKKSAKRKTKKKEDFKEVGDVIEKKKPEKSIIDMNPDEVEEEVLMEREELNKMDDIDVEYDLDIEFDEDKY